MNRNLSKTVYDAVMETARLSGINLMRDALEPGTRIVEDLNFDSLARATLVMQLENCLQIVCENRDADGATTLGDVVVICQRLLNGRPEPSP